MCFVYDVDECCDEVVYFGFVDDQWWDELDDFDVVVGDLGEDLVLVEECVHDCLGEQFFTGYL